MFARALREFMLWPEPCTGRMRMGEDVCTMYVKSGVWGSRPVCLLGGWCLCYRWLERSLQHNQKEHRGGTSTVGAVSVTSSGEDPESQRQGETCFVDSRAVEWFGRAGSDVRSKLALFLAC